jgi:polyisoprenoid-binding protein YceI
MNGLAPFLIALGFCGQALAQNTTLQFDPAQTHIEWTLDTALHTVHGTFTLKRGMIHFDPVSGKADGELVVDTASGESGNRLRDHRMHREILETRHYPEILFVPARVEGKINLNGTSHVQVHGELTIHGDSHAFVLPIEARAEQGQLTATTSFGIRYMDWGIKNPGKFFLTVGDTVHLTINAAGRLSN